MDSFRSPTGHNQIEYMLVRSNRKTVSIQLQPDGSVLVRAPLRMREADIRRFVQSKADWIEAHRAKLTERQAALSKIEKLTDQELDALHRQAKLVFPERVRYYAPLVGVSYGNITIRSQHTRWGSCSARGNLNFNCLLMLAPPEVLDSVVVHELCHRKQMNHSPAFYREVYRVFPEYDKWHQWLKQNGPALMQRLPEQED